MNKNISILLNSLNGIDDFSDLMDLHDEWEKESQKDVEIHTSLIKHNNIKVKTPFVITQRIIDELIAKAKQQWAKCIYDAANASKNQSLREYFEKHFINWGYCVEKLNIIKIYYDEKSDMSLCLIWPVDFHEKTKTLHMIFAQVFKQESNKPIKNENNLKNAYNFFLYKGHLAKINKNNSITIINDDEFLKSCCLWEHFNGYMWVDKENNFLVNPIIWKEVDGFGSYEIFFDDGGLIINGHRGIIRVWPEVVEGKDYIIAPNVHFPNLETIKPNIVTFEENINVSQFKDDL